jgi:hypothetical protein
VDKTLNIGHLLTTFVLAGSVFMYASGMDRRVAVLEEKAQSQAKLSEQAQINTRELATDVKNEIRLLRSDVMSILREKSAK